MGQHQGAAGRQRVDQGAHDAVRVLVVGYEVHERDEGECDRPAEVEEATGVVEDRLRIAHIGLDVVRGAFGPADQQGLRVAQDDGVVVRVDDPRRRHRSPGRSGAGSARWGCPVPMSRNWSTPAAGQPGCRAVHERTVLPCRVLRLRGQFLPHPLIDTVVVLAAQEPVVHPRRMRLAGVDLGLGSTCRHVRLLTRGGGRERDGRARGSDQTVGQVAPRPSVLGQTTNCRDGPGR